MRVYRFKTSTPSTASARLTAAQRVGQFRSFLFVIVAGLAPIFTPGQAVSQGSAIGVGVPIPVPPPLQSLPKGVPAPQNDGWLDHFPSWLGLTNKCFSQVPPSYENLIERTIAKMVMDGALNGAEVGLSQVELKNHGRSSFKLLSVADIGERMAGLSAAGIGARVVPSTGASYEVPYRRLFYAVDGAGSCVLEIRTLSASLSPLLKYGGMSNDYFMNDASRDNNPIHPSRFAIKDSINIRVLDAQWRGQEYRATYVMKGGFGVDNERLSRLEVLQEKGRAVVVLRPATEKDWKRLGMESAAAEFPASESIQYQMAGFLSAFIDVTPNKGWMINWKKGKNVAVSLKPSDWPFKYLTEEATKQLPAQLWTTNQSSPSAMNSDLTFGFAAVPKGYGIASYVTLLSGQFYGAQHAGRRMQALTDPVTDHLKLTLLPPKPGEGTAKGLSTYRLEGEPAGEKRTFELIIKTRGALPDDKVETFAQLRQIPNASEATPLLGTTQSAKPNTKPKK
jgi:hypothetical protein